MKRTVRLTANDEREKLKIVIKLNADYSNDFYPREKVNERVNTIVDNIVKKILLEDYNFKDIKAHKK